ncbi:MAG: hypothetical protein SCALA702_25640 [Melioribacteraceae bacterium]|nr:MAG: hypothetical protein SCALA702_25640 [Melioribacteraceae bacterium]
MLITMDWLRSNFTDWGNYFLDDQNAPSEDELESELLLAEAEFKRYISVTEEEMTDSLRLYLLNIIKKRGFDRLNLANSFEFKPRAVIDYENTIAELDKIRRGEIKSISENKGISVTPKPPGEWFHP